MEDIRRRYSVPTHVEEAQRKYWDILGTLQDVMETKQMEEQEAKLLEDPVCR